MCRQQFFQLMQYMYIYIRACMHQYIIYACMYDCSQGRWVTNERERSIGPFIQSGRIVTCKKHTQTTKVSEKGLITQFIYFLINQVMIMTQINNVKFKIIRVIMGHFAQRIIFFGEEQFRINYSILSDISKCMSICMHYECICLHCRKMQIEMGSPVTFRLSSVWKRGCDEILAQPLFKSLRNTRCKGWKSQSREIRERSGT
eukprot:TRINITY_DN35984_c0_g1_i1.p3 TRINITY_DN35984_c0_g1~~TRINITY_DN35984_c0_g1_i1.p3  ORF type:complete len:202 (+),score=-15.07 TRINITY_DN35984_c0_g1_i1:47-652(+)